MSVIIRKRICTPSETAIDFWAPAHQNSPELDSDAELLPVINRACLFVDRSFPLEVVVRKMYCASAQKMDAKSIETCYFYSEPRIESP